MANLFADRVKDTTTTTGTGDITLSGSPPTGFQSFNAAFGTGTNFYYCIEGGAEWEVGIGTLSASTTLVRSVVTASSNSGAAVNFSAGTKNVFCTIAAHGVYERAIETSGGNFTAGAVPSTDYVYLLAGAHVPTMPTAVGNTNKYTFTNNHTTPIAFSTTSAQTIAGHASTVFHIYPSETISLYSDNSNWLTDATGKWRTIRANAHEARLNTTTVSTHGVLFFPMVSGKRYVFDLWINIFGDTADPDFKYSITAPSASQARHWIRDTSVAFGTPPTRDDFGSSSLPANVAIIVNAGVGMLRIQGSYLPTGSGLFGLQFAQNTLDATDNIYVLEGASLKFIEN
jgi:hypothetical protein